MVALGLFSCTERIDIQLDEMKYARLVVEGGISTDTTEHTVKLTKTAGYFDQRPPEPVTGARVIISGSSETYELTEIPSNSGIYRTSPDAFGKAGEEYHLRIELNEPIGGFKVYEAKSRIFPINTIDSIGLRFHPSWGRNGFWEVKCYVWDPPTEDYYMFQTLINGRITTDSIKHFFVVNDQFFNGNYSNGIGVNFLDQSLDYEKIQPGDTITLKALRLTKEHAEFIWQVQDEIRYQTPLFSGPPANVKGNISNGAIGFFGGWSVSSASAVVPQR